jgi:hypothetical protein
MIVMGLVKLYFILGLAMFLVASWDFKFLPKTARRLVKKSNGEKGYAMVALSIRNLTVMALFTFFLWPAVLLIELAGRGENKD